MNIVNRLIFIGDTIEVIGFKRDGEEFYSYRSIYIGSLLEVTNILYNNSARKRSRVCKNCTENMCIAATNKKYKKGYNCSCIFKKVFD